MRCHNSDEYCARAELYRRCIQIIQGSVYTLQDIYCDRGINEQMKVLCRSIDLLEDFCAEVSGQNMYDQGDLSYFIGWATCKCDPLSAFRSISINVEDKMMSSSELVSVILLYYYILLDCAVASNSSNISSVSCSGLRGDDCYELIVSSNYGFDFGFTDSMLCKLLLNQIRGRMSIDERQGCVSIFF